MLVRQTMTVHQTDQKYIMVYQKKKKKKFSSKVQFKTTPETIKFCQCHWSTTSRCVLKGQIAEDSNPEAHRENKQTKEHNSSHFYRLLTQWFCSQLKGIWETREDDFRNDFFLPL